MRDDSCNISNCFLCRHCIPEWKEVIAVKKKTILFKKGEMLFKEGQKVNGIYFLYSGAVKVHKRWVSSGELIIRFTKEGDILGHRGLRTDLYPVSATTLVESKACYIPNDFLETTLKTDHSFTYTLMQFYSDELQKAEMRMRNLAFMEVNVRIAETLLEIHSIFGIDKTGFISVPVTRQDIATYSGTTYESVFKFLRTLVASKTIAVNGKSIRIVNEGKLQKMIKNKM